MKDILRFCARIPLAVDTTISKYPVIWLCLLAALFLLTGIHCLPTISGDWYRSGNDMSYILPVLQHATDADILHWFKGPWIGVQLFAYYRPITSLFWYVEYQIFGEAVSQWQIVSMTLHCIATVLLALLLNQVFKNRLAAFIGAFVWATRLKIVNTLEWTPAQTDHFAGFFGISALLAFQLGLDAWNRGKHRALYLTLSVLLALIAMGSKEIAYTIPLLSILLTIKSPKLTPKDRLSLLTGAFGILLLFFIWRVIAMHGFGFLPGTSTPGRGTGTSLTLGHWLERMRAFLLPASLQSITIVPIPPLLALSATLWLIFAIPGRKQKIIVGIIGATITTLLFGGIDFWFLKDAFSLTAVGVISTLFVYLPIRYRFKEAIWLLFWGLVAHIPLYHVVYNAAGNVTYLPGIYWAFAWATLIVVLLDLLGTPNDTNG